MNNWTLISYYTEKTYYEDIVQTYLLKSLKEFPNIKTKIVGIENQGDWYDNTRYKATFIKQMLTELKSSIVFVDCDAKLRQYPKLFDTINCDIAFHLARWRGNHLELLSGTLYVNYTEASLDILDKWIIENEKNPRHWEQKNLQTVIKNNCKNVNIRFLPSTYCQIFDLMKGSENPVIEHFQKSRVHKKKGHLIK